MVWPAATSPGGLPWPKLRTRCIALSVGGFRGDVYQNVVFAEPIWVRMGGERQTPFSVFFYSSTIISNVSPGPFPGGTVTPTNPSSLLLTTPANPSLFSSEATYPTPSLWTY